MRVMGENTAYGRFRPYFLSADYGRKVALWSISPIIGIGSPSPRRSLESMVLLKQAGSITYQIVSNYYLKINATYVPTIEDSKGRKYGETTASVLYVRKIQRIYSR